MSAETLIAFLNKIAQDPSLQKEFVDLAARHGYDLSSNEMEEGELDGVVGGMTVSSIAGEAGDKDHKGWIDLLSITSALKSDLLP